MKLQKTKNILPSSNLLKLNFLGPFKINWFNILSSEIEASLPECMAILPRFTSLSVVIDDLFHVKSLRSKLKLCSPSQLVTGYVSIICIRRLVSGKISWVEGNISRVKLYKVTDTIYSKHSTKVIINVNYSLIVL